MKIYDIIIMSNNIMDQIEETVLQTEAELEEEIDYEELERQLEEAAHQELYNSIINKTSNLDLDSLMTKRKPASSTKIPRHKPSKIMSLNLHQNVQMKKENN